MGRKRNPYIQLFTRDILSSPRCRALSESAAGVYLFLLCRLNEPPTPGAYRISDWELHPTWKRSKTQQCLAEPNKYERLQYFAAMLSKNDLPWKQSSILGGLQELYKYGIIVVEGDMLIQPRMYKDNRFDLPDLDNDGAPVNTILDDPTSGSMAPENDEEFIENKRDIKGIEKCTENGTEKVQQKVHVSHAPATRALRVENMSNNINNSKGNIGGAGGNNANKEKTGANNPDGENEHGEGKKKTVKTNTTSDSKKKNTQEYVTIDGKPIGADADDTGPTFSDFWEAYDKQVNMIEAEDYWGVLSRQDKEAIMEYIPRYKIAQPRKQFRKNPVTFLRMRAWHDEIITDTRIDTNNNDRQASNDHSRHNTASGGRNQEQEAAALREQTVRLIERNRAQRAAAQADGTDTGDDPF